MTTTSDPSGDAGTSNPAPPAEEPTTFDAEYVRKLRAEAADWRTKARSGEEAQKRLAEIEDAQKSETQKLTDAKVAAEAALTAAQADALRWKIAAKHGISDEQAELFLTGTDEDALTKQAEALAALRTAGGTPPAPRPDLSQGGRPAAPSGDPAGAFAQFITRQMSG